MSEEKQKRIFEEYSQRSKFIDRFFFHRDELIFFGPAGLKKKRPKITMFFSLDLFIKKVCVFVCLPKKTRSRGKKFQKLEKKEEKNNNVCRLFTHGGLLRNRLPLSRITTTARQRERETERQRDREFSLLLSRRRRRQRQQDLREREAMRERRKEQ
jgi:hypothetical protein